MIYEYSLKHQSSILAPGGTTKLEYDNYNQYKNKLISMSQFETLINNTTLEAKSLLVVFYCFQYGQNWWPTWGKSSSENGQGMGGSEEVTTYAYSFIILLFNKY
jgi:hypothetical protein